MLNANAKLKPISIAEKIIKGTGYEISDAVLYGVTEDGSYFELGRAPDVFNLLEGDFPSIGIVGLAAHVTGWAAPRDSGGESEGPASKHPDRKRIAMVAVLIAESMGSAMSFADDPDKVLTEELGPGALADALKECLVRSSRQNGEKVTARMISELRMTHL